MKQLLCTHLSRKVEGLALRNLSNPSELFREKVLNPVLILKNKQQISQINIFLKFIFKTFISSD
jgi:hypothetical protein